MSDWIENGEAGSSVRGKLNTLRGVIALTTGASPITVTPQQGKVIYHITSGGTGSDEIILLDDFTFEDSGFAPEKIKSTAQFIFTTQTNAADVIKVRRPDAAADSTFDTYDAIGIHLGYAEELVLSDEGQYVTSNWGGQNWDFNKSLSLTSSQLLQTRQPMPAVPSYRDAVLVSQSGTPMFIRDPGMGYMDEVPVSGADPITLNESTRNSLITTGGTGGVELIDLPASNAHAGFVHLIVLFVKTNVGDSLSLSVANIADEDGNPVTSITFDAAGEWLLLECWDDPGTTWRIRRGTATVA